MIYQATNYSEGMSARVFNHTKGFSIVLHDDDSDMSLDAVTIVKTMQEAIEKANYMVGI